MKPNQKKRLALDEVAAILLIEDSRTIQSYIEKGWIPAISYDEQTMTVDAAMLAKSLGVENFDEPFIEKSEAVKILGVNPNNMLLYCRRTGINMYQLSDCGRIKFLFRKSDLEKAVQVQLQFHPFGIEEQARRNVAKIVASSLSTICNLFGIDDRSATILKMHLDGKNLEEIGKDQEMSRERVRQILEKIIKRLRWYASKVKDLDDVFKGSSYFSMSAALLRDTLEKSRQYAGENHLLREQVESLTKQLREKGLEIPDMYPVDMPNTLFLGTKLVDLNLSPRALNCCKAAELETFGDLIKMTKIDLLRFRNFGKKSLTELEGLVKSNGFQFKQ